MNTTTTSPSLVARFETNERGEPIFIESGGRKHYRIVYEVENAPELTYAATFELDPSYYDPNRTLRADKDGKFRLKTTAYGDYDVKVRLRTKEGDLPLALSSLTDALTKSRDQMGTTPAIDEAIRYIASH